MTSTAPAAALASLDDLEQPAAVLEQRVTGIGARLDALEARLNPPQ